VYNGNELNWTELPVRLLTYFTTPSGVTASKAPWGKHFRCPPLPQGMSVFQKKMTGWIVALLRHGQDRVWQAFCWSKLNKYLNEYRYTRFLSFCLLFSFFLSLEIRLNSVVQSKQSVAQKRPLPLGALRQLPYFASPNWTEISVQFSRTVHAFTHSSWDNATRHISIYVTTARNRWAADYTILPVHYMVTLNHHVYPMQFY